MKVQLQPGVLRLRIDEAELATLQDGGTVTLTLNHGAAVRWTFTVAFDAAIDRIDLQAPAPSQLSVRMPERDVRAYAATLPRRDALSFGLPCDAPGDDALTRIDFEVDVRDSIRARGAMRSA